MVKCRRMGIARAMRAVMMIVGREGDISEDSRPCTSDQAMVEGTVTAGEVPVFCVVECTVVFFVETRLRIRRRRQKCSRKHHASFIHIAATTMERLQ